MMVNQVAHLLVSKLLGLLQVVLQVKHNTTCRGCALQCRLYVPLFISRRCQLFFFKVQFILTCLV